MSIVEIYKKGEGKLTRRPAFYALCVILIWGFKEFGKWLTSFEWGKPILFGSEEDTFLLPYYQMKVRVGVIVAIALTGVAIWLLFKLLNRPRSADLLVDTETELKKVSWPSWSDTKQSTVIVLIFVVSMAAYMTGVEFLLKKIFDFVLTTF